MLERSVRLKTSWEGRTADAKEKARSAIRILLASNEEVTFTAVHKQSGVSKNFLYKNQELRSEIEQYREYNEGVQKSKLEKRKKTEKSRDTVIEAKDRRIKKLEEENRRLKLEIDVLRGQLYDIK